MFLPVSGANRDRTTDMMRYRGNTIKSNPMSANQTVQSSLEKYFDLSQDIKEQISRLDLNFDHLLRKQRECLRPTFADSSDIMNEINGLTNSINSSIFSISEQINKIKYNGSGFSENEDAIITDRQKILENIRTNLTNLLEEFSLKFQTSQQTFLASFNLKNEGNKKQKEISYDDFSSLKKLNGEMDENQQYLLQQQELMQRRNEEIAQIAQREEEIRSIFLNLSNLIVQQGTVIDRIDYCVTASLENAEVAHKEVEKAASYQKKSRMWTCVLFLSVFVVVLIIMALFK